MWGEAFSSGRIVVQGWKGQVGQEIRKRCLGHSIIRTLNHITKKKVKLILSACICFL